MIKNWHLFFVLITINSLIILLTNKFILTADLYYKSFSNRLTLEQIHEVFYIHKDYSWTAYLLQALIILIKTNLTAFCLYIGLFFSDSRSNYTKLLKITLFGEGIFLFYSGIRLFFIAHKNLESLEQIQTYWPVSLYNIFSNNSIPAWAIYPLSAFNIAQVLYWLLLALGITLLLKTNYQKSFRIVMSSYGIGFLCWMLLVVFLQVYFLPSGTV